MKPTKNNQIRRITTLDHSSLTNVTPLDDKVKSRILFESTVDDDDDNIENPYIIRAPALMIFSQRIQVKHPEQLNDVKLNYRSSSVADLPSVPANYSFVFYGFTSTSAF